MVIFAVWLFLTVGTVLVVKTAKITIGVPIVTGIPTPTVVPTDGGGDRVHGVPRQWRQQTGASTAGDGGMHPPTFWQGGMQCLSSPLAATNLCQSSQCHIQLSVDCHSSCMNGDIWRWHSSTSHHSLEDRLLYNLLYKWTGLLAILLKSIGNTNTNTTDLRFVLLTYWKAEINWCCWRMAAGGGGSGSTVSSLSGGPGQSPT